MVTAQHGIITSEQHYTTQQFRDLLRLFDPAYQYELRGGVIYKMAPSNMVPSKIGVRIGFYLTAYLLENDLGHLTDAAGGYDLSNEDTFAPDVGFISYKQLPQDVEGGFIPMAPDFAVEVVSPSDKHDAVRDKARKYLELGSRLVWIVYQKAERVEVFQLGSDDTVTLTKKVVDETLSGDPVLPNFKLPVRKIFAVKKPS